MLAKPAPVTIIFSLYACTRKLSIFKVVFLLNKTNLAYVEYWYFGSFLCTKMLKFEDSIVFPVKNT